MTEEKKGIRTAHNLILKERKLLNISGILDVGSFDDNEVVVYTDLGELTIKGENLHINKINLDDGNLELDGEVFLLEYAEDKPTGKSFLSKIFR